MTARCRPWRGDVGMEVVALVVCALVVSAAPNATRRREAPDHDEDELDYYDEAKINISGQTSEGSRHISCYVSALTATVDLTVTDSVNYTDVTF